MCSLVVDYASYIFTFIIFNNNTSTILGIFNFGKDKRSYQSTQYKEKGRDHHDSCLADMVHVLFTIHTFRYTL